MVKTFTYWVFYPIIPDDQIFRQGKEEELKITIDYSINPFSKKPTILAVDMITETTQRVIQWNSLTPEERELVIDHAMVLLICKERGDNINSRPRFGGFLN